MKIPYVLVTLLLLSFICPKVALSSAATDSLLNELSHLIREDKSFIKQKNEQIEQLKKRLKEEDHLPLTHQYSLYNRLYSEYRKLKYDSAFTYALKLQEVARQLNDPVRMTHSKLKTSFILVSSGMYKEALDSLETIRLQNMPDSIKANYYALAAHANYDLATYIQNQYYSSKYIKTGDAYADSAFALLNARSIPFHELKAMQAGMASQLEKAKVHLQTLLEQFDLTPNQTAMACHSLGNIYYQLGDTDKAIELMTRSAILDMKTPTKEGVALMTLAEFLYKSGDESRAYDYIKKAMEDATYYGAKQRKVRVASILPIIEGERLATVEAQRTRLFIYLVVVILLSAVVVTSAFIIFRQVKLLRAAKRTLTQALDQLQETNNKLIEANKIKEEYIGYSFNVYSEYLEKIDKLKKAINRKLLAKKYDEISHVMSSVNLKEDREILFHNFDKIFTRLFPDFVSYFNSYFEEQDKIKLKSKNSLNADLRIFALLRLGIHDHEQIAHFLGYSLRTIYNYKNKVKNRSTLKNDDFESKILEAKAF